MIVIDREKIIETSLGESHGSAERANLYGLLSASVIESIIIKKISELSMAIYQYWNKYSTVTI